MHRRRAALAPVLTFAALCAACRRPPPAPAPVEDAALSPVAPMDAGTARDVFVPPVDAGPPRVLTIRVVNAGTAPMTVLTNPDTNEILHTRHLFPRRNPDAGSGLSVDGELVKFFRVGQEPSCRDDGGAGYGGLGQPEPHTLAPGASLEFTWDGVQHREVLSSRGVCQTEVTPDSGRYRFEFDQPYNMPQCNRQIVTLPLAPDAPRTLEIRCTPRPQPGHEEN
ncbi:MAG: hypothetical protein WCJ30_24050 [Deltaproteobacteria bacterium]